MANDPSGHELAVAGDAHFETVVREEARADIHEQWHAEMQRLVVSGSASERAIAESYADSLTKPIPEWKVMDRHCWSCGTHGASFVSTTRCAQCGELQRLYVKDA